MNLGPRQPYEAIDIAGRKVVVYPDGSVINSRTNSFVKDNTAQTPTSPLSNTYNIFSDNNFIVPLFLITLVAIVAMVAITKNGK